MPFGVRCTLNMISLKKYFSREPDVETAYRRIIGLFLQGIALHAVEGDKAEFEQFRDDMDRCSATLSPDTSTAELLVVVGGSLRAMEDYNQRTSKFVRRQSTELQHIVSMLTEAVITIGSSSEQSVSRLQNIEKSIEGTQAVEDIQILKLRLKECLEAVHEEAQRQKRDGQDALVTLQQELDNSRERMGIAPAAPEMDAATGLPGKGEAERAIRNALVSPAHKFLVVAVSPRVQAVNARFGYAVGDRVLAALAEHFRKGLSASDQIYRWRGPTLVALIERAESVERIRTEIRQFADARLERTIEIGHRTVLIPISAAWVVFPLEPPMDVFLKQVEIFTTAQLPREAA
jgi:GGDEF domain-containing protein